MRSHLQGFLTYLTVQRGRPQRSAAQYGLRVTQFVTWLERKGIDPDPKNITRALVDAFMEALYFELGSLSNSTRSNKLSAIRSFFDYLVYKGHLEKNPTTGVPSPKSFSRMPRVFSTHELRKLFQAQDINTFQGLRDAAVLRTIYGAGLRKSELSGLRLRDVADRGGGFINIYVHGKGSKERVLTLRQRPAKFLRLWLAKRLTVQTQADALFLTSKGLTRPLGERSVTNILKKYARIVGIPEPEAFVHKLRATWATDLYDAGVGLLEICAMAGWDDPKTAMDYVRVSQKTLRKAAIPDARWKELDGDGDAQQ